MQNHLAFTIPSYTDADSTFPRPVNGHYDYWPPLIHYFLAKTDTIEIHCWNEEMDAIEELNKLNTLEPCKNETFTVLKGRKTSTLTDYLLNNYMHSSGEFKWFTVNLDHGELPVFHSGHWATEFFVPNATEKDMAFIKKTAPAETGFHPY